MHRTTGCRCLLLLSVMSVLIWVGGCGDGGADDPGEDVADVDCGPDLVYNPARGRCVVPADVGDGEDAADQADGEDTSDEEAAPLEDTIDPTCDEDGDGYEATRCGGGDCDDALFDRNPGREEVCDALDNDCDGRLNEDLVCSFYAHTSTKLYAIDPFKRSATVVADLPSFDGKSLTDVDTHPDGTLYGITTDAVYLFVPSALRWFEVDRFDTSIQFATGLAFDFLGVAFITAANDLYTIDVELGISEPVGAMGGGFYSSGDCVVDKFNTLYMTSRGAPGDDRLVLIERDTARTTEIGSIGFGEVFGLTFSFGQLYGLTTAGELIRIDPETGRGELEYVFQGGDDEYRFFGAASTPNR